MLTSTTTGYISRVFNEKTAVEMIAKAGFEAYDFSIHIYDPDSPIYSDNYIDFLNKIKVGADKAGIICNQAHAPFPSSSGNEEEDKIIFQRITRSMDAAAYLGAKTIVVHPKQHLIYAENSEKLFEINMDFLKALIPYCESFGIKVAIENLWQRNPANRSIGDSVCSRAWEYKRYLDTIKSPFITGCLDIGHTALIGSDIAEFIKDMGKERLTCLHIHDNNMIDDLHALPFTQKIDFPPIMKALKDIGYTGEFTYEADNFLKKLPAELLYDGLVFMNKVSKHLVSL